MPSFLSEGTIIKIEQGHRKGRSIILRSLTMALGVGPEALLPAEDPQPPTEGSGRAHPTVRFAGEARGRAFEEALSEAYAAMERWPGRPSGVDHAELRAVSRAQRTGSICARRPRDR